MKRLIFAIIFSIAIITVLFTVMNNDDMKKVDNLVIYGDNIVSDYDFFVENDCVYIPFKVVEKAIDNNIYYDEVASKVIITNKDYFIKYTIDESVYLENLEEKSLTNIFKEVDDIPYIPISEIKDVYNVDVSYNEDLNIISIDKKNENTGKVLFNKTYVYSYIETDSNVLEELSLDDEVLVYLDSLNHNRWYKVKTKDNIVGYVFKDNIELNETVVVEQEEVVKNDKIVMYWQYGTNLDTLTKEEGVNTVSPTFYEVSDTKGNIISRSNKAYVDKAHSLDYKVWPIISNGYDNSDYLASDISLLMNSESARENLIRNIEEILINDNLDGINIDFESMKKDDKYMFVQFLRELAPIVRKHDKVISVDIYFVEYIDRPGVGEACDYTILMGYDQRGSWSSESGSISEIPWVKENVNSLIKDSNIPSNKIILGVPFYTRLFTETSGSSVPSSAVAYTIINSKYYVNINGLTPVYDENAMQNYVEYTRGSNTYKMWLEDEVSMKNRVDVINEMNLSGLAAWRKGYETDEIWQVINDNIGGN